MLRHVIAALTPPNQLAMEVSLVTGLRISDVLSIRTAQIQTGRRITIREQKTGKRRRLTLPRELHGRMRAQAGRKYVWQGRLSEEKPRTRQAVHKDMLRARKAFRLRGVIAPHTARKVFAVELYRKSGLKAVQDTLGHSHVTTTMLYALADQLTLKRAPRRGSK